MVIWRLLVIFQVILMVIVLVLLGNADKLGGKEASNYITNNRFIELTGEITLTSAGGSTTLNYPSGYNKDNCVVIACGITYNSQSWRAFGTVQASVSTGVRLNTTNLTVCCYPIQNNVSPSGTFDYKIILMKTI